MSTTANIIMAKDRVLAEPNFGEVSSLIEEYTTEIQTIGFILIVAAMIIVGIRIGFSSAVSNQGVRAGIGSLGGIIVGAVILGLAFVVAPMLTGS